MSNLKQVFYNYKEWEDYQAGVWRTVPPKEHDELLEWCIKFTGDHELYGDAMKKVTRHWPKSTRHHLTNSSINQKAWIGHAACCFEKYCPEYITREAWNLLTESQQRNANNVASIAINEWKQNYQAMGKQPIGINVYKAAQQRIEWTFDNFDKIYLSFSAGKDSTVMLHMVMDEAIKRGRKIGVLLIDLEGQYRLTMEHAENCFQMYKDYIDLYWIMIIRLTVV